METSELKSEENDSEEPDEKALTISPRDLVSPKNFKATLREALEYREEREWLDRTRPKTRGECQEGVRPCPYMLCKYHLFLDVNPETGAIKINFPNSDLEKLKQTCALDVADKGGMGLNKAGKKMNLCRERIRQLQKDILAKCLKHGAILEGFLDSPYVNTDFPSPPKKDKPNGTSSPADNGSNHADDDGMEMDFPEDITLDW